MSFEKVTLPAQPVKKRKKSHDVDVPKIHISYNFEAKAFTCDDEIEHEIYSSIFKYNRSYWFASQHEGKFLCVDTRKELEDLIIQSYPIKTKVMKNKILLCLPKEQISHALALNTAYAKSERIDPFLPCTTIEFENKHLIETTHKLIIKPPKSMTNNRVIADYKDHFPMLDEVIEWIVACRFTPVRRKSFLHLRCNANFGKSFLKEIFKDLEVGYEMNVEDFRAPSGVNPDDIRKTFVLFIDEFRTFKQEYKNITNTLPIDSKHRAKEDIEVFAKVFLSAEYSPSFTDGVDPQISERVSVIDIQDKVLSSRPCYIQEGGEHYFNVVKFYVYEYITALINSYIALGKESASKKAQEILDVFHGKYSITSASIEDEMKNILYEIIQEKDTLYLNKMTHEQKILFSDQNISSSGDGSYYISHKFVEKAFEYHSEAFHKKARFKITVQNIERIFNTEYKKVSTVNARRRMYNITLPR